MSFYRSNRKLNPYDRRPVYEDNSVRYILKLNEDKKKQEQQQETEKPKHQKEKKITTATTTAKKVTTLKKKKVQPSKLGRKKTPAKKTKKEKQHEGVRPEEETKTNEEVTEKNFITL